jgi:hypothetical protein
MATEYPQTSNVPSSFSILITEKLTKINYRLWRAQILPPIRAAQMKDLLLGREKMPDKMMSTSSTDASSSERTNPEYVRLRMRDQALLRYLMSSVTREVLMGITTAEYAAEAWNTLQEMYGSYTRARSISNCIMLTRKVTSTMADYFSKMKSYADEMVASGQLLTDEDFTTYVLTGLDEEFYNPLVLSIVTRVESIALPELYSQMLSYELCVNKQSGGGYGSQFSANAAARGRGAPQRGGPGTRRGHGRGRGPGRGFSSPQSRGSFPNNSNYWCHAPIDPSTGHERPKCQVCYKLGHTSNICWYRFDEEFVPDTRVAAMASTSIGNDPNWYLESGATDHITGELERLTMHECYTGNDQIRAANGVGMDISHVGKSILPSPSRPLYLNNILHVPHAHKQLMSIHLFFFLIRDQATRKVHLHGPCRGGLYPLPQHLPSPTQHLILSAIKPSPEWWHCRLGHPTCDIVSCIIRTNKLSCSPSDSIELVCDACLRGKAH